MTPLRRRLSRSRRPAARIPHGRSAPDRAPTLILLHRGARLRRHVGRFPGQACRPRPAPACSPIRASGYGHSSPAKLPRQLDFMHVEARETLPRLLDAIGFRQGLLVGHSDGASIAAIYGGSVQDHRVRGLVLMAPHFIVEDVTINVDPGNPQGLRHHRPAAALPALARRRRRHGARLVRRLAEQRFQRPGISATISPTSACRC